MTVSDLLLTLNNDTRIIVYEFVPGKLFESYLFETNWSSSVWGYYMDRKVRGITPSGTQTNVLKITIYQEENEDE